AYSQNTAVFGAVLGVSTDCWKRPLETPQTKIKGPSPGGDFSPIWNPPSGTLGRPPALSGTVDVITAIWKGPSVRSGSSLQSEVLQLFSAGLRLQTVLDLQLCLALLRLQQISALLRLQQSLSDLGWTEGCPGDEPSLMSL
ncbi:hypothetical protein KUCAC02_000079, partial [Chaenocephalus aceratus]